MDEVGYLEKVSSLITSLWPYINVLIYYIIRYLTTFNTAMQSQNRRVVLLCDNASCHKVEGLTLSHVEVVFLPPNLTAWLQPMDAGIIRAFKGKYRSLFAQHALDRDAAGISEPYKIDQLEAMRLADSAWDDVSPETIQNCWRHTGICPEGDLEGLEGLFARAKL